MTSHDVIAILRKRMNTRRIGHAGTLDPMATGLLVIAVGAATRFLQYLPMEPKVYRAKIQFGRSTSTYDVEGETTFEGPVPADLAERLNQIWPNFLGLQQQLPPMHSAVKVNGQPLYQYARRGEEVERKSRRIHITSIDVLHQTSDQVEIEVVCSGGTYIRTLADDIGRAVGCGGHLAGLVRTSVGKFSVESATGPKDPKLAQLIPLREALHPMPERVMSPLEFARVQNGNPIANSDLESEFVMLLSPTEEVVSVARVEGDFLRPECVLPHEVLNGS